jgi:hypothetical protein
MRAEQRHKMQRNALDEWLGKAADRLKPFANLGMLLALAVVLAIVAGILWVRQSRTQSSQGWAFLYQALSTGNPTALDEVANKYSKTEVGRLADVLGADANLGVGTGQLFDNKSAAGDDLRKAVNQYLVILDVTPKWSDSVAFLHRNFVALPRLVRWAVIVLALGVVVAACVLPFTFGISFARKRGWPPSTGWKIGLIPFGVVVAAAIAACVGLPQILRALGADPTPPQLAMLHERASFGLARAYEALAGTRQSQGELDKAVKAYEEVVKKWPQGPYGRLAAQRLDELKEQDTKVLYDKFAEFTPRPPSSGTPGMPGGRPPFGVGGMSEEALPGVPEPATSGESATAPASSEGATPPAAEPSGPAAAGPETQPAEKPSPEKPVAETPSAEKPAAESPPAEKPAAETPPAEKSAADQPSAGGQPSGEKPAASEGPEKTSE